MRPLAIGDQPILQVQSVPGLAHESRTIYDFSQVCQLPVTQACEVKAADKQGLHNSSRLKLPILVRLRVARFVALRFGRLSEH